MITQATTTELYVAPPASFTEENGNWFGELTDGTGFSTYRIPDTTLMRFSLGTTVWYVSEKGIILAADDMTAFSQYLSL